jgi:chromosomal replication initiation ATPase DnaA
MLNREEIYTKKRLRPNVEARAAIYYYLREKTPLSFHKIANKYGKNHATVIHGAKLWGNLISTSKKYMQQNELIIKQINN